MTMSEIGEVWDIIKKQGQSKRAKNRTDSKAYLKCRGIPFIPKNHGAHLIVTYAQQTVDFWPGTGKWIVRGCGHEARGVRRLVQYLEKHDGTH